VLKQVPFFLAIPLSDISVEAEESARSRFDRQASLDANQNPSHSLLNRLADFSIHAAAELLGQTLPVSFEPGRGDLDHCGLLGALQARQLGLESRLASFGSTQRRLQGPEIPTRHGTSVIGDLALHLGEGFPQFLHPGPGCCSLRPQPGIRSGEHPSEDGRGQQLLLEDLQQLRLDDSLG